MWTTQAELAWLRERIPAFHEIQDAPNEQIQTWLRKMMTEFLAKFPVHSEAPYNKTVAVCSLLYIQRAAPDLFFRGCATGILTITTNQQTIQTPESPLL